MKHTETDRLLRSGTQTGPPIYGGAHGLAGVFTMKHMAFPADPPDRVLERKNRQGHRSVESLLTLGRKEHDLHGVEDDECVKRR